MGITGLAAGNFTDLLNSLADMDFFSYVLPFLLVFAFVFGILSTTKILGGNKGVIGVIALSIGLLSLQFDIVPNFFGRIFPFAGVGLAIIMVLVLLTGLFIDPSKAGIMNGLLVIAAIVALIIILMSLSSSTWQFGFIFEKYQTWIITILVIVVVVGVIFAGSSNQQTPGNNITIPIPSFRA